MKAVVEGIMVKVLTEGRRFDLKKADEINRNSVQQKRPAGPKTTEAKKPEEKAYARLEDAAGQKAEMPDEISKVETASTGTPDDKKAVSDEKSGEKIISETDMLKIYLQQSMEENKRLERELETARKEKENIEVSMRKVSEKYTSLANEYENYRRRTTEEKASINDDAVVQVVSALLPALDSLERAMDFADSNAESFQKGVEMTLRQLSDGFKKLGVEEIEAQSQPFSPDVHNAVMHVEDKTLGESVVTDVFQKGYRIRDRIIRHSMVKVAN